MDKLSHFKVLTDETITGVLNSTPDDKLYTTLLSELGKLTRVINTGNILVNVTPEGKIQFIPDDSKPVEFTTDDQVTKLREENQALQDRVNELENDFKELHRILNDPEYREQVWENLKNE